MAIAISIVLAGFMGVILGMLGAGGSIVTVPILRYVVGFEAKEAIALSLAVVGVTSLIGAVGHWRSGHARLGVALPFGLVAMIGAYAGARLAVYFSGDTQLFLFALLMLAAAVSMLRKGSPDEPPPAHPKGSRRWTRLALIGVLGFGMGVVTGLVGIGGGFMILPVLVILMRMSMREAVGTSLIVMAMKSVTGVLGYIDQVQIPWGFYSAFTAVAIVGIVAGTYLIQYVKPEQLKRAFAYFLFAMAALMLYNNREAIAEQAVHAAEWVLP
ncbi:MAG: sulfite exporter TauE/SafE family protein [SAR324 cluster bacterium]|nr:sulfite exporter TauE/SafE family protein [SAR324 cluster bacterium]